jgi:hypothetical protein
MKIGSVRSVMAAADPATPVKKSKLKDLLVVGASRLRKLGSGRLKKLLIVDGSGLLVLALPGGGGAQAVWVRKNNVNLEGRKNCYLVVEFNVLFRDQDLGRKVVSDKPTPENSIMRSIILDVISGKTLEDASELEVREIIVPVGEG